MQSIDRTLDILEALVSAKDDVTISQLHERVGLPVGTLHRLLSALTARGYAAQDRASRRYGPGPKLIEIAARAMNNDRFSLRRVARPQLEELTADTGETTNLVARQGDHGVYIDQVPSPRLVRMFTEIGHEAPLYCSGAGKAILAGFTRQQLDGYLATARLLPWTSQTITLPDLLREEIERVRVRGFATDDEEREDGVRCVAAPIFDRSGACIGAISVSGPTTRLNPEWAERLGDRVRRAADRCSAELGYSVPRRGAAAAEGL